jgi:hypothetical protein
MRIIEYKTAVGSFVPELDREVMTLIRQGFQPFGSQYFQTWEIEGMMDKYGFFQPMVKYEGNGTAG